MVGLLGYLKTLKYAMQQNFSILWRFSQRSTQELSADDVLSGDKTENKLKWGLKKLVNPWSKNKWKINGRNQDNKCNGWWINKTTNKVKQVNYHILNETKRTIRLNRISVISWFLTGSRANIIFRVFRERLMHVRTGLHNKHPHRTDLKKLNVAQVTAVVTQINLRQRAPIEVQLRGRS